MLRHINSLFDSKFVNIVSPLLKDNSTCRVVRAKLKSGVDAVIKIVSNSDDGDKKRARREVKLLRMFSAKQAPHICSFMDATVTTTCTAIMLECMELGTVRDFLDKAHPEHTIADPAVASGATRLRLRSLMHMSTDVLTGLAVMHENGIIHRDIKPANIGARMMPTLGRVGFKIIDLGIAVGEIAREDISPSSPRHPSPLPPLSPPASPRPMRHTFMTGICTGVVELKRLRGSPLFMSPDHLDGQVCAHPL